MQQRIIDPPKDQWDLLCPRLTSGESEVAKLFHYKLPLEWEIYIQPYLNGLRPDFVLLNPYAGIAVFEIKDWNLKTLQYSTISNRKTPSPINQIERYEEEIFNLYCPRLNDYYGKAVITAGLIFTKVPQAEVDRLLDPYRHKGVKQYRDRYPFSGSERVEKGNIDELFPESKKWGKLNPSRSMSSDTAADLRGWLKEPAFSQEQRKPLNLNEDQREIARERTTTGYRRVKGPAGSGKSLALAARAAVLASEGKQVLVCTFNITLMNYLRDLVARHARELAEKQTTRPQVIRQQIEFRHFHGWCKQVCTLTGHEDDYSQLWKRYSKAEVMNDHMAKLVLQIYEDLEGSDVLPIYDAILVDEGQDYRLLWWKTLRKAVTPDGEKLLVADKTQNIYGTATAWTDEAMKDAGFSGVWKELKTSYRLPDKIIQILEKFSDDFLRPLGEEVDLARSEQTELDFNPKTELRWVQMSSGGPTAEVCFEEVRRQMQRLRSDTANPDIIFLTQNNDMGLELVEKCEQAGIRALHTFGQEDQDYKKNEASRRKKLAFFLGDARVKATTLHSFKGWEGRHLILHVSRIASSEDRALFYTALSRTKKHRNGSMLTVVSSCPDLHDFGFNNFRPNFECPCRECSFSQ